jgi:CRISPR-associated protein Cas5h
MDMKMDMNKNINDNIYELISKKNNNKFLVFDVYSDYGHFRKYYTTSSPLTFSVIPRTAIIGIISAIIGIPKDIYGNNNSDYFELLKPNNTIIALSLLNPINKIRLGLNLLDCKSDGQRTRIFHDISKLKEPLKIYRTQVNIEFLKNPKYRIYISIEDKDIYQKLKYNLLNKLTVFTPYMGLSFCLLNYQYINEYEIKEIKENYNSNFDTIIDIDNLEDLELNLESDNKFYMKEKIAYLMDNKRQTIKYKTFLFENNGKPIKATLKKTLILKDITNNQIALSVF